MDAYVEPLAWGRIGVRALQAPGMGATGEHGCMEVRMGERGNGS